mgnify:CR=1 FL=1
MAFKKGDIVVFKRVYPINVLDIINAKRFYSKYMIVVSTVDHVKPACKVLCANGEINWVAENRLELVTRIDEK